MYGKACPVSAGRRRIRPSAVISEGGKKQLPFGGIIRCGGRLDIHVKSRRRRRLARAEYRRLAFHDAAVPDCGFITPVRSRIESQFAAGSARPNGPGDRKSVVAGKGGSVSVDHGGRGILK